MTSYEEDVVERIRDHVAFLVDTIKHDKDDLEYVKMCIHDYELLIDMLGEH